MSKTLRHISLSICGAVMAACLIISYIAGRSQRNALTCERLKVTVLDSLENRFVSDKDIRTILDKTYGQYIGIPADSIDLVAIEDIVRRRSAVLESQAYITKDGTLHIDITQRKPIVRFQKNDGGFYADAQGYIFPLQSSFASHVQIIDGHVPLAANSGYKGELTDPAQKEWLEKIMNLVNFLEGRSEWRDMFVQIHVSENSELVLIPRQGKEKFLFGQPDRLEDKFEKIRKYYTAVVPEKGSEKYKVVDVRFKGQIICR